MLTTGVLQPVEAAGADPWLEARGPPRPARATGSLPTPLLEGPGGRVELEVRLEGVAGRLSLILLCQAAVRFRGATPRYLLAMPLVPHPHPGSGDLFECT